MDTNVLIGLEQRYPRDVFPSAWSAMEEVIDDSRACICQEVLEETKRGTDQLHEWAAGYPGFVCPTSADEIALASSISQAHEDWVRELTNAADPFLIAHASVTERIIVTEERRAGPQVSNRNQKVPNVADGLGVMTMSFIEFARSERWQF
ncbi:MAG: DUF4411 family protein [Microbacteriaceae bacterium]